VRTHWDGGRHHAQNALMRFVKLASSGVEYLLYATAARADLVLALVFKADAPISTVRLRAREAAVALGKLPAGPPPAPSAAPAPPRAQAQPAAPVPPAPTVQTATMPGWTMAPAQPSAQASAAEPPPQVVLDRGLQLSGDEALSGVARTPHALYDLTYAIVWAPKFPKTRLVGNIARSLDEWIRHIALSYDWRVDRVEVRPECVIVVVNCPPEIAPERVITTLKRTTSERVFVEFPSIAADHPGGDFWAPGYLLLGAGQMVTPQQIGDFLAFTRREQGLRR
jgi:putative transposase